MIAHVDGDGKSAADEARYDAQAARCTIAVLQRQRPALIAATKLHFTEPFAPLLEFLARASQLASSQQGGHQSNLRHWRPDCGARKRKWEREGTRGGRRTRKTHIRAAGGTIPQRPLSLLSTTTAATYAVKARMLAVTPRWVFPFRCLVVAAVPA